MPEYGLRALSVQKKLCLWIVAALVALGMVKAGYYTLRYGGCDLRARVVGARAMQAGYSPYFYKWTTGAPERLADPNDNPGRRVNGVSVAPGVLFLQSVFAQLPYPALRVLWTVIQYLLALVLFWWALREARDNARAGFHIIVIGGLFFLCSQIWMYNIERGQLYLLYAFFFMLLYRLHASGKPSGRFLAGAVLALAVYCRPTMGVAVVPFLVAGSGWTLAGLAAGGLPLALHAFLQAGVWKDYFAAMALYAGQSSAGTAPAVQPLYPAVIEGTANLARYKTDFTAGGLPSLDMLLHPLWPGSHSALYMTLYTVLLALLVLLLRTRLRRDDSVSLLLIAFLLYMLTEYIMPAPRAGYNVIQWLFPVLVLLPRDRLTPVQLVWLVAGCCLMAGFPLTLPYLNGVGEALLLVVLAGYCRKVSGRGQATETTAG